MLSVFNSGKVIDLFSGCGTFTLPAAKRSEVLAIDKTKSMLSAIEKAWRETSGLKNVTSRSQDLFIEPVGKEELNSFDSAIIDPLGEVLKEASSVDEEILIADIEPERVTEVRETFTFINDRSK